MILPTTIPPWRMCKFLRIRSYPKTGNNPRQNRWGPPGLLGNPEPKSKNLRNTFTENPKALKRLVGDPCWVLVLHIVAGTSEKVGINYHQLDLQESSTLRDNGVR